MSRETRTAQLQIRVSRRQKAALHRAARAAHTTVSAWVLSKALPSKRREFERLLAELARTSAATPVLATLNDLLTSLDPAEVSDVLGMPADAKLPTRLACLVAAMVEHAAYRKHVPVPGWIERVPALEQPYFATELTSLRLHLLAHSPPAFRRRNLFVDATLGDRV
jgi:uncharacterized protein (DUF1778 family)